MLPLPYLTIHPDTPAVGFNQLFHSGGTITTKLIQNDVTTGWMPAAANLLSDVLTLHGMSQTLADGKTDEHVLS